MPPMPRPATRPVTLTPRLSRMTMMAIANRATVTSRRMIADGDAERGSACLVADACSIRAEDQLARPDRRLDREGDDEQRVDQMLARRRRLGIARDESSGGTTMKRSWSWRATRPITLRQPMLWPGSRATMRCADVAAATSIDRDNGAATTSADSSAVAIGDEPGDEAGVIAIGHRPRSWLQLLAAAAAAIKSCAWLRSSCARQKFDQRRPRRDDRYLRARGRSMPVERVARSSLTASISAGWT